MKKRVMNYGLKISKKGENVIDISSEHDEAVGGNISHVYSALAIPYLNGAVDQVKRYKNASAKLPSNPIEGVNKCLHEVSCLLEDLATISHYLERKGVSHPLHELWTQSRNHIRHDVRENFDVDSDRRKRLRLEYFEIDPTLQTCIGFDPNGFNIGNKTIDLSLISEYLAWASKIIADIMSKSNS